MSGVEGLARADRLGMQGVGWGGEFTSPSRISSAIISVEKSCKKTTPLAASRNNPSLMTSACRASNLHRAILLPSDNLVNVVWAHKDIELIRELSARDAEVLYGSASGRQAV